MDNSSSTNNNKALGAVFDGNGVDFSIFSANATKIELCLFSDDGKETKIELNEKDENGIWNTYVEGLKPGQKYGYRVHGPYEPENGHLFNPNKLLIDPYAKQLDGEFSWEKDALLVTNDQDSANCVPKCVIVNDKELEGDGNYPNVSWDKTVVYEAHPRGFTIMNKNIPEELRGKFLALGDKETINYLKSIGITSLELLPVQSHTTGSYLAHLTGLAKDKETINDFLNSFDMNASSYDNREKLLSILESKGRRNHNTYLNSDILTGMAENLKNMGKSKEWINDFFTGDIENKNRNYWGYDPINYFATHPAYGSPKEFKEMTKNLHDAGIEVIMDVVYNHTGEGNKNSIAVSFKGIDNASYYRMDNNSNYVDDTGCGNTLDLNKPMANRMAMDSLKHFVKMGVDGFRFDLASTNARDENNEYKRDSKFLEAIKNDPILSKTKLIAEPWDCVMGGYQVGNFPTPWREWNDKFRDDVRRFWCGRHGLAASMARRMTASDDLRRHDDNKSPSINFVTAHDGFTLHDLVTYQHKHNNGNGEEGRDGSGDNSNWNSGVEGPSNNADLEAYRAKRERNMMATLLLARGTPMIVAGDEFSKSQGGNNNPFNQDNEISWVNWDSITEDNKQHIELVSTLNKLRAEHPVIGSADYFTGDVVDANGNKDIMWYRPDGNQMEGQDWEAGYARSMSYVINGASAKDENGKSDDDFLVIMNAHNDSIDYKLPPAPAGGKWEFVIDTSHNNTKEVQERNSVESGSNFTIPAESVIVMTCKRDSENKTLNRSVINSILKSKSH